MYISDRLNLHTPGQAPRLQLLVVFEDPEQETLSLEGGGLSHNLHLDVWPFPQVTEQGVHSDHSPHPAGTESNMANTL